MSKKFEIVQRRWIKNIQKLHGQWSEEIVKLEAVHSLISFDDDEPYKGGRCISLRYESYGLKFYYKKEEQEEYNADLKFLEELIGRF